MILEYLKINGTIKNAEIRELCVLRNSKLEQLLIRRLKKCLFLGLELVRQPNIN